jgi:hypothetical protein
MAPPLSWWRLVGQFGRKASFFALARHRSTQEHAQRRVLGTALGQKPFEVG